MAKVNKGLFWDKQFRAFNKIFVETFSLFVFVIKL